MAATSVHAAGKHRSAVPPGDRHPALLQRLSQGLEGVAGELGELVEEQYAAVGQADLPGPQQAPPPTSAAREAV